MGGEDLAEQNGIPNRAWLVLAKVYRLSGGRVGSPPPLTLVLLRDSSFVRTRPSFGSDRTERSSFNVLRKTLPCPFVLLLFLSHPSSTLLSHFFHLSFTRIPLKYSKRSWLWEICNSFAVCYLERIQFSNIIDRLQSIFCIVETYLRVSHCSSLIVNKQLRDLLSVSKVFQLAIFQITFSYFLC